MDVAEQTLRNSAFSRWGRADGACLGQQVTTMKCKRATWSQNQALGMPIFAVSALSLSKIRIILDSNACFP